MKLTEELIQEKEKIAYRLRYASNLKQTKWILANT